MEYDPAFPTGDHVKKKKKHKKNVSTIPLPGAFPSLCEIPMPGLSIEDVELPPEPPPMTYLDVPLPSMPAEVPLPPTPPMAAFTSAMAVPEVKVAGEKQPVKFQMKVSTKPTTVNDNADAPKPLTSSIAALSGRPSLKVGNSLVKRMRAGVLPTGVLSGRKKPVENESVPVVVPATKEVERFVPPTINAATVVDPSLTLSSDMLDAAKRAISQINSALLGVPNTPDASAASAPTGLPPAPLHPGQPLMAAASPKVASQPDTSPTSPPVKRRRSRSLSARSGKAKKQRYRSRSSASSDTSSRRDRRRRRRRSRSVRRRRGRSANRRRHSRSREERRRRGNAKERSRSPPQSRRGRSRSLRRALSRSNSASSSSSYSSSESSESSEHSTEKLEDKAEKKEQKRSENASRKRRETEKGREEKKDQRSGHGWQREKDRREAERSEMDTAGEKESAKRSPKDQERHAKERRNSQDVGRREKERDGARESERRDRGKIDSKDKGGKSDRSREQDRNASHSSRNKYEKENEKRWKDRSVNKDASQNGDKDRSSARESEKERSFAKDGSREHERKGSDRSKGKDRKDQSRSGDSERDKRRRREPEGRTERAQSSDRSAERNRKKTKEESASGTFFASSHRDHNRNRTDEENLDRGGNRRPDAKKKESNTKNRPEKQSSDRIATKPVVLQHLKEELEEEEGSSQQKKAVKQEFSTPKLHEARKDRHADQRREDRHVDQRHEERYVSQRREDRGRNDTKEEGRSPERSADNRRNERHTDTRRDERGRKETKEPRSPERNMETRREDRGRKETKEEPKSPERLVDVRREDKGRIEMKEEARSPERSTDSRRDERHIDTRRDNRGRKETKEEPKSPERPVDSRHDDRGVKKTKELRSPERREDSRRENQELKKTKKEPRSPERHVDSRRDDRGLKKTKEEPKTPERREDSRREGRGRKEIKGEPRSPDRSVDNRREDRGRKETRGEPRSQERHADTRHEERYTDSRREERGRKESKEDPRSQEYNVDTRREERGRKEVTEDLKSQERREDRGRKETKEETRSPDRRREDRHVDHRRGDRHVDHHADRNTDHRREDRHEDQHTNHRREDRHADHHEDNRQADHHTDRRREDRHIDHRREDKHVDHHENNRRNDRYEDQHTDHRCDDRHADHRREERRGEHREDHRRDDRYEDHHTDQRRDNRHADHREDRLDDRYEDHHADHRREERHTDHREDHRRDGRYEDHHAEERHTEHRDDYRHDDRYADRHEEPRRDDRLRKEAWLLRRDQKRDLGSEETPEAKRRSGVSVPRRRRSVSPREEPRVASSGYKTLKEEAEERAQRRREELRREKRREVCEEGRRRKERRRSHSHSPPPSDRSARGSERTRVPGTTVERHERAGDRHERGSRDRAGHHEGRSPMRHRRPRSPSSSPPPTRRDLEPESRKGEKQSAEFMQILKKFDDFFNALSNMSSSKPEASAPEPGPASLEVKHRPAKPARDTRARHHRRKSSSSSSSSAMSVSGGSSPGISPAGRKAPSKQHPPGSSGPHPSCSVQPDWPAESEHHPEYSAAFNFAAATAAAHQQQWPHDSAAFEAHHSYPQAFGHEAFSGISNQDYQQLLFQQQQQQQQQLFPLYETSVGSWQAPFHPPCAGPLVPHSDFGQLMNEAPHQRMNIPPLMQQEAWPAAFTPHATQELETGMHEMTHRAGREGFPEPLHISMESAASLTSGAPTSGAIVGIGPSTPPQNGQDDEDEVRQEEEEEEEDEEEEEEEEDEGSMCGVEGGAGSELEVELGEGDHPSLAPDDLSSIGDKEMHPKLDDDSGSWNERGRVGPRTPALEDLYPDAPKPVYDHIDENEFRSRSLMRSRSKLETNRWVCDCTVPNPDEAAQGMKPCGEDCINRVLNIECGSRCPIAELCTNRQFQEKRMAPVEPFYAGPDKGWGLRSRERISPGTFVIEYVGEVIDFREFKRRIVAYERDGHAHHYFMALEADTFADAGTKGNWARFVNHSCEPNAETQKWNVLGQIRIGFFAKRPIDKGEEITIDYQFVQFGRTEQKCYCGTASCTGIMGSTSKQLQEKVRVRDTRTVERRFAKLLSLDALKNVEDVQLLLKVLVQEYLLRDARFDLLALVLRTESEACLKMFRQYNGLELLASYMRDSDTTDWAMKQRLLEVLDKIPVMEQKQLRSGTNLFSIVRQWSVDPRFCRQRTTLTQSSCGGSASGSGKGGDSVVPSPATTATTNEDGEAGEAADVGSLGPGVDLETGEKTGPEADLDQQAIEPLRELALRLLAKWEQLPDEIYRIPKVERHETEQLLQPEGRQCQRSSVLSSSQQRAPLVSWGLDKKRPASPPKATTGLGSGTPRLPKDEFRRLFEAYVRFEEEQKKLSEEQKKLSEQRKQHEIDLSKIHDPSLQDAVEKIRQLLSRTLLHAIEQLKRGMQPQLVLPPDLTEVAQDEKVQRLLGELQHVEMSQLLTLLSGCDGPGAEGALLAGERGSALLSGPGLPGPEEQLPPNWKWARDTDGRLYFYHVLTKKTQWEAPLYPWDAGEEDPEAYCYNTAFHFQVTHEEIAAMNVRIQKILKDKAKAQKAHRKKSAKRAGRKEANWEEKHRARFHKQMYKIIASHLHKYRSPEVRLGRITSSADLKYLGKKLSLTILHKEMKAVRTTEDLEVNANVTSKAIAYVDKYMSGRGSVYMRHGVARRGSTTAATPSQRSMPEEAKVSGPVTPGPEPKDEADTLGFEEGSPLPPMADEELKELDGLL